MLKGDTSLATFSYWISIRLCHSSAWLQVLFGIVRVLRPHPFYTICMKHKNLVSQGNLVRKFFPFTAISKILNIRSTCVRSLLINRSCEHSFSPVRLKKLLYNEVQRCQPSPKGVKRYDGRGVRHIGQRLADVNLPATYKQSKWNSWEQGRVNEVPRVIPSRQMTQSSFSRAEVSSSKL